MYIKKALLILLLLFTPAHADLDKPCLQVSSQGQYYRFQYTEVTDTSNLTYMTTQECQPPAVPNVTYEGGFRVNYFGDPDYNATRNQFTFDYDPVTKEPTKMYFAPFNGPGMATMTVPTNPQVSIPTPGDWTSIPINSLIQGNVDTTYGAATTHFFYNGNYQTMEIAGLDIIGEYLCINIALFYDVSAFNPYGLHCVPKTFAASPNVFTEFIEGDKSPSKLHNGAITFLPDSWTLKSTHNITALIRDYWVSETGGPSILGAINLTPLSPNYTSTHLLKYFHTVGETLPAYPIPGFTKTDRYRGMGTVTIGAHNYVFFIESSAIGASWYGFPDEGPNGAIDECVTAKGYHADEYGVLFHFIPESWLLTAIQEPDPEASAHHPSPFTVDVTNYFGTTTNPSSPPCRFIGGVSSEGTTNSVYVMHNKLQQPPGYSAWMPVIKKFTFTPSN